MNTGTTKHLLGEAIILNQVNKKKKRHASLTACFHASKQTEKLLNKLLARETGSVEPGNISGFGLPRIPNKTLQTMRRGRGTNSKRAVSKAFRRRALNSNATRQLQKKKEKKKLIKKSFILIFPFVFCLPLHSTSPYDGPQKTLRAHRSQSKCR